MAKLAYNLRERNEYVQLAELVGHKHVDTYAEEIINFRNGMPDKTRRDDWLYQYEDDVFEIDDDTKKKIPQRLERFWKLQHRRLMDDTAAALAVVNAQIKMTGKAKQPTLLKYGMDGVNQGMLVHSASSPKQEQVNAGNGLVINVMPRTLRGKQTKKDAERIVNGTFTEIKTLASGS